MNIHYLLHSNAPAKLEKHLSSATKTFICASTLPLHTFCSRRTASIGLSFIFLSVASSAAGYNGTELDSH